MNEFSLIYNSLLFALYLSGLGLSLTLFVRTLKRYFLPTARPLNIISLALVFPCLIQLSLLLDTPIAIFQSLFSPTYLLSLVFLPAWLWFMDEYRQERQHLSLCFLFLAIEPVVIGTAFIYHISPQLIQPNFVYINHNELLSEVGFEHYRKFHIGYSFLLFVATFAWSLRIIHKKISASIKEMLLFSVCFAIPVIMFNAYALGFISVRIGAPTLVLLLLWGARQTRLLDTMPLAIQSLIEEVNFGIVVTNLNQKMVFINEQARALLGNLEYPSSILDKPVSIPELLKRKFNFSKPSNRIAEITLSDLSGDTVLSAKHIILSDRGKRIGTVITLSDVTAQKEYETERANYAKKLEELDSQKSDFFAGISHEFRTSLALSLGPIRDLKNELHGALPPNIKQQLSVAENNNQRLLSLVNQLLEIAELEGKKIALNYQKINLAEFIKTTTSAFESLLNKQNILLEINCPKFHEMTVDVAAFEKIIFNLVSNSIKSIEGKGLITITAKAINKNHTELRIKDNGCGMSKEVQGNVFDRFFHFPNNKTQHNSGIGLALVKQLADSHKAKISLQSVEGEGSEFILRFPDLSANIEISPATQTNIPHVDGADVVHPLNTVLRLDSNASSQQNSKLAESKLVLVVEDNSQMRSYIRFHLGSEFRLIEAEDGQEGLTMIEQIMPDIIISDLMMPNMDGYEFCNAIKDDIRYSHIPVILLTALTNQSTKLKGLHSGADAFLNKPFDPDELQALMANLISTQSKHAVHLKQQFSDNKLVPLKYKNKNELFLDKVTTYIQKNIADSDIRVKDIAQSVHMSERTLTRKLHSMLGEKPQKILLETRLRHAKNLLLKTQASVSEVANASGFESPSYFSHKFKEAYAKTPTQLRTDEDRPTVSILNAN